MVDGKPAFTGKVGAEVTEDEGYRAARITILRLPCGVAGGDRLTRPRAPNCKADGMGRGIQLIFQACRDAGTPQPQLSMEGQDLWLEFAFAAGYLQAVSSKGGGERSPEPAGKSSGKTPVETPVKTPVQILAALEANPELTLAALALSIGKSLSAVERATAKLVKEGKVRFVGPHKGGHWKVQP